MTEMSPASSASDVPALALNSVEVVYDQSFLAIKGVSLEVPQGGMVAILGSNESRLVSYSAKAKMPLRSSRKSAPLSW